MSNQDVNRDASTVNDAIESNWDLNNAVDNSFLVPGADGPTSLGFATVGLGSKAHNNNKEFNYQEALRETESFLTGQSDPSTSRLDKNQATLGELASVLKGNKNPEAYQALTNLEDRANRLGDMKKIAQGIYEMDPKGQHADAKDKRAVMDALDGLRAEAQGTATKKQLDSSAAYHKTVADFESRLKGGQEPVLVNYLKEKYHIQDPAGRLGELNKDMSEKGDCVVHADGTTTQAKNTTHAKNTVNPAPHKELNKDMSEKGDCVVHADGTTTQAKNTTHAKNTVNPAPHKAHRSEPEIDPGLHAPSKIAASIRETANLKAPVIDPTLRMVSAAAPVINAQQAPAPIVRQAPPVATTTTPEQAVACAPVATGGIDVANLRGDDLKNYLKSQERQQKEADKEADRARKDAAKEEKAEKKEAKKEAKAAQLNGVGVTTQSTITAVAAVGGLGLVLEGPAVYYGGPRAGIDWYEIKRERDATRYEAALMHRSVPNVGFRPVGGPSHSFGPHR